MGIQIDKAPEVYRKYLSSGDGKGNKNNQVDTYDEAEVAANEFCSADPSNCQKFLDYLAKQQNYIFTINPAQSTTISLKVESLGLTGLLRKMLKDRGVSADALNDQEIWDYYFENAEKLPKVSEALKSQGFINPLEDPGGEISAWAHKATLGAKDDYERFVKIKKAMKDKVKYDMDPRKRSGLQTAYDVFKKGFGDCGEISNLFWVAAKALGFEVGFLGDLKAFSNLIFVDGIILVEIGHIYNWIKMGEDMFSLDLTEPDPLLGVIDPNDRRLSLQEQIAFHYLDSTNTYADKPAASTVFELAGEILPQFPEDIARWYVYGYLFQATTAYLQGKSDNISVDELSVDELLDGTAHLLELNPDDFALYYLRGLIYEKKGKDESNKELLNKAIESFEAALKENPYLIMAYYHLGSLYLELGAKVLAWNAFMGLIQKFPKDFSTNLRLGGMLGEIGNLKAAEEFFKEGLKIFDEPSIHLKLALLHIVRNELVQAEEELKEAKDQAKEILGKSYSLEALFFIKQLNFSKAEESLKKRFEIDPEYKLSSSLLRLNALKNLTEGRIDEAIKNLKEVPAESPSNEEIYNWLGLCLMAQSRFTEAESYLKKALTLSKVDSWRFLRTLLPLYIISGEDKKVMETLQAMSKNLVIELFGLDILNIQDVQKAESKIKEALSQIYDKSMSLHTLGEISLAKGEVEKAKGYFEKSIKENPEGNPARSFLAFIYLAEKQIKKAEAILETSKDEGDLISLSSIYLAQKKYQQAEKILEKLIDSGTKNQAVYLQLWLIYFIQGKVEAAKEIFKKFIQFADQRVSF